MGWDDLTKTQRRLLARACRHPVVFSGQELDEDRLGMLQLYALGLVRHASSWRTRGAMEWHGTEAGQAVVRAARARGGLD